MAQGITPKRFGIVAHIELHVEDDQRIPVTEPAIARIGSKMSSLNPVIAVCRGLAR